MYTSVHQNRYMYIVGLSYVANKCFCLKVAEKYPVIPFQTTASAEGAQIPPAGTIS